MKRNKDEGARFKVHNKIFVRFLNCSSCVDLTCSSEAFDAFSRETWSIIIMEGLEVDKVSPLGGFVVFSAGASLWPIINHLNNDWGTL